MSIRLKLHSKKWFIKRIDKSILQEIIIENPIFNNLCHFHKIKVKNLKHAIKLFKQQNREFSKFISYE
jgi:Na+/phosphate symporter